MTARYITKARKRLRLAGSPTDRDQVRLSLISRAQYEISELGQQLRSLAEEFRRFLSCWLQVDVPADTIPYPLLNDIRVGNLFGIAALAALVGEMFLAGWFFYRNEVDWRVGAGSVLVITLIFHASVFYVAYGTVGRHRPHAALDNLRFFILPAAFLFVVAVVLGVLPRYLDGQAAADQDVHYLLSAGLLIGTLSMMVLAAALACAHFIYTTTKRYSERYHALLREIEMTRAFLGELERQSAGQPAAPFNDHLVAPGASSDHGPATIHGAVASTILLAVALSLGGCVSHAAGQMPAAGDLTSVSSAHADSHAGKMPVPAEQAAISKAQADYPTCEVDIDRSGSVIWTDDMQAQLRCKLQTVVEEFRCLSVSVSVFDKDGWAPQTVLVIDLPRPPRLERRRLSSEWTDLKNVRDALALEAQRVHAAAEVAYSRTVSEALRGVETAKLIPSTDFQSTRTDVVGVLRRYATYSGTSVRLVVLVSDLGDTQHRNLPPVSRPAGNIRVVSLILPMKQPDAYLLGLSVFASDQYDNRANWVKAGAPWVLAAPFFVRDLGGLFRTMSVTVGPAGS